MNTKILFFFTVISISFLGAVAAPMDSNDEDDAEKVLVGRAVDEDAVTLEANFNTDNGKIQLKFWLEDPDYADDDDESDRHVWKPLPYDEYSHGYYDDTTLLRRYFDARQRALRPLSRYYRNGHHDEEEEGD